MKANLRGPASTKGASTDASSAELDHALIDQSPLRECRPNLLQSITKDDTLGQFSYAPTTQTTVITTTTTTTTQFPPLTLRAPKHLSDLDPTLFPLAASPTPQSIRTLCFEIDGRKTIFEESSDPVDTVAKLEARNRALFKERGTLETICRSYDQVEDSTSIGRKDTLFHLSTKVSPSPTVGRDAGIKRSASVVSVSESANTVSDCRPRKRQQLGLNDEKATGSMTPAPKFPAAAPHLRTTQTSTPMTPHVSDLSRRSNQIRRDWHPEDTVQSRTTDSIHVRLTEEDMTEEDLQIPSPRSEDARSEQTSDDTQGFDNPQSGMNSTTPWPRLQARPPLESFDGDEVQETRIIREPGPIDSPPATTRAHPTNLNTCALQDASLPSPSLSPVTASANMLQRRSYFEPTRPTSRYRSIPMSPDATITPHREAPTPSQEQQAISRYLHTSNGPDLKLDHVRANQNPSFMSIPQLVESYEAIPEEMKQYVIYQYLRRSSRKVLRFVAGAVNPALKWDFLKHLPAELSENVLGHLDVKSLCAASQVSKRWKHSVNTSEKVWKRLFFVNGFTLQEGELARAIREGWGWQTVPDLDAAEQDLSALVSVTGDRELMLPPTPLDGSVFQGTRSRARRIRTKLRNSASKGARARKNGQTNGEPDADDELALSPRPSTDGPYTAAVAAAAAIFLPQQEMHLWKSIYMRHHIIQQTWLTETVAPRHIAFRAHQRHVVTCLQFDSEKILTGSDDANINVYDTQTGVLRARLEGHEGGVWALQYEGNVLVSGSTDRSVRVWDIERGVCTHTFHGHTSTVRCLQILLPVRIGTSVNGKPIIMPKQPLIATGSRDSHLRLWKLPKAGDAEFHQSEPAPDATSESPHFLRCLTGHAQSVRAIAGHGDTLISGSYDNTVRVWRVSTGETVYRLTGHTQKVYSVVLDSKRNRCISGSMDNVVKVWSLDTGMALFNLEGHSSLVGLLDLQQDRLVSAAADSTLRIWDPENGICRNTLKAHTGAITCFQHDAQKVISGSDRNLKMWNISTGEFARDLLTDLSGVWQVKFNDRRCVAAVQRNNHTFIEILDFGAARDGVPATKRGRRILVDSNGCEVVDHAPDAIAEDHQPPNLMD